MRHESSPFPEASFVRLHLSLDLHSWQELNRKSRDEAHLSGLHTSSRNFLTMVMHQKHLISPDWICKHLVQNIARVEVWRCGWELFIPVCKVELKCEDKQ